MITILLFIMLATPHAPAMAIAGGEITRSEVESFETMSREEKISYLWSEVRRLQAILDNLIRQQSGVSDSGTAALAPKISVTIDYRERQTRVLFDGYVPRLQDISYPTIDKDDILNRLMRKTGKSRGVVQSEWVISEINRDALQSVVVRIGTDRSLAIRTEDFNDTLENIVVSKDELLNEFLLPLVGNRAVAERVFDGYVSEVRRGTVPDELYEFLEIVLDEPMTPVLKDAIEFRIR